MRFKFIEPDKPDEWPANARECSLENLWVALNSFLKDPNHKTKEVLLSLVCHYDLNQDSQIGLHRVTEYEVYLINSLYVLAGTINLNSLKTYLYEIVHKTTREHIMLCKMIDIDHNINSYDLLIDSLKLYYASCHNFYIEKEKSFSERVLEIIKNQIEYDSGPENIYYTTHSFLTMLNDISYFNSKKTTPLWAFTRDELLILFEWVAKMVKMNKESPVVRPLKGVLMTMISNYMLKSRNNYNEGDICKYIPEKVAEMSIGNHQLWLSKIQYLNDDREMKVIPELFFNADWLTKDWAKKIDFTATRTYYVSSFSKTVANTNMNDEYGQCIYGYKDDRIAELISPIHITESEGEKIPHFSQVIAFDVIYDKEEAKKEINLLCDIIDKFEMTFDEKNEFLEQIMQYWILSVKDNSWKIEKERRYVIFLYEKYNYIEMDISDDRFLKVKTSLLLTPDFILGENPVKWYIKMCIDEKREAISKKDYLLCHNCFSRDYDYLTKTKHKCHICDSEDTEIVQITGKKKV